MDRLKLVGLPAVLLMLWMAAVAFVASELTTVPASLAKIDAKTAPVPAPGAARLAGR